MDLGSDDGAYESWVDQHLEQEGTMPKVEKMTIQYDDGTGETWHQDGGWAHDPNPIHAILKAEAERYQPLIVALNWGAPLWGPAEWEFETSGGGLTHATASWVDTNGDRSAWIAIDDNNGDVMIGAYWGPEIEDMVFEAHLVEGERIESFGPARRGLIAAKASMAVAAIKTLINCGHTEHDLIEETWHEDDETMEQVRKCRVCGRQATMLGTLVYEMPDRKDWS